MLTRFSVPPLHTQTRTLAAVAMGREAPDLVVTGARVLSTYTERIHREREIWIKSGRIATIKPAGSFKQAKMGGATTRIYDARGGIIAPGLVDPHVHIESSMMTACAFAEAALLNGTTTVFCDSHEIGNVCDVAGIEWMLEDARQSPLSIFLTVPSTVPATNASLETAGGDLTPDKIGGLFDRWPEAAALGEKMDYISVAMGDARSHTILAEALKRGRPVCGHIYGREFVAAGAASGITDTHEAIDREIANDFLENGVWIFLRGGNPKTPWHSLPQAIKAVTELGANAKRVCVCTDDRDADDLFLFGLDWVVRQGGGGRIADDHGVEPGFAASSNPIRDGRRFGGLGPARRADLVLLNDALEVQNTWYGGELVVEKRTVTPVLEQALTRRYKYPAEAYRTIKLPRRVKLTPPLPEKKVTANIIRVVPPGILTAHDQAELSPADSWDAHLDQHALCFLTVVERHGKNGGVGLGLLRDFGLRKGAVASSVGHDAHNVVIAGTNEADMQVALATVKEMKGGVCVVRGGKVLARVALPIAGLLSDQRAPIVAKETTALKRAWVQVGCKVPYMGFNLLPLSVIPELRLTDKGLIDVIAMKVVPLFAQH